MGKVTLSGGNWIQLAANTVDPKPEPPKRRKKKKKPSPIRADEVRKQIRAARGVGDYEKTLQLLGRLKPILATIYGKGTPRNEKFQREMRDHRNWATQVKKAQKTRSLSVAPSQERCIHDLINCQCALCLKA